MHFINKKTVFHSNIIEIGWTDRDEAILINLFLILIVIFSIDFMKLILNIIVCLSFELTCLWLITNAYENMLSFIFCHKVESRNDIGKIHLHFEEISTITR